MGSTHPPITNAEAPAPRQHPHPRLSFLGLPVELRICVYKFALDFDGVARTLDRCCAERGQTTRDPIVMSTPGVLLVNKQVSHEALDVLHKKRLRIPHHAFTQWYTKKNGILMNTMCRPLLQKLRHVSFERHINYSGSFSDIRKSGGHYYLGCFVWPAVEIWLEKNSLHTLEVVMFYPSPKPGRPDRPARLNYKDYTTLMAVPVHVVGVHCDDGRMAMEVLAVLAEDMNKLASSYCNVMLDMRNPGKFALHSLEQSR